MTGICDLLIRGGDIVDGSGAPAAPGDIAVRGDRIVAVGDCSGWQAEHRLDAGGLAVCPGFIDAHSHDDKLLFDDPAMRPKVSQGVTTVVVGNCGISVAPLTRGELPEPLYEMASAFRFARFADYLAALDAAPAAANAACLVGHTTIRVEAMSDIGRRADETELAAMRAHCREALDAGAIGLSSGLFYPPAQAADWSEVAALVELVGAAGGVYTAHLRDEGSKVIAAIDEACRIAAHGDAPLIVSHHKVMGRPNFGRSAETLAYLVEAGRRQPVGFDVYPYVAGASMLSPAIAALSARTIVTWSERRPEFAGRDLCDIAAELQLSEADACAALAPGGATYFLMDEADVRRILTHEGAMIGSDGIANAHPHPRLWGTFPRVLGHYARELGLFSFEEAVRRMTSLTAGRFGLNGRGALAVGNFADVALIDRDAVSDAATFEAPTRISSGVVSVLVNGRIVWDGGQPTGARPGRVLRRATA